MRQRIHYFGGIVVQFCGRIHLGNMQSSRLRYSKYDQRSGHIFLEQRTLHAFRNRTKWYRMHDQRERGIYLLFTRALRAGQLQQRSSRKLFFAHTGGAVKKDYLGHIRGNSLRPSLVWHD